MRKFLAFALLAISLGGCATFEKDWAIVTGTTISPTQIIVAANAFDAAEASATQYLLYCKAQATPPSYCARATRVSVISGVRAGRAVRAQLEPYIVSGTAGPAALYNSLVAAVTSLQTQIPATGAAQ
jgi:hypothetical protein